MNCPECNNRMKSHLDSNELKRLEYYCPSCNVKYMLKIEVVKTEVHQYGSYPEFIKPVEEIHTLIKINNDGGNCSNII